MRRWDRRYLREHPSVHRPDVRGGGASDDWEYAPGSRTAEDYTALLDHLEGRRAGESTSHGQEKARPEFNLSSTEPAAAAADSSDWVYRSPEAPADQHADAASVVSVPATALGKAQQIVSSYSRYAAAAGLIPLPAVDVVVVGSLQLKMVSALAANYGIAFNDNLGQALVAAIAGDVGSTKVAYGFGGSLVKSIPLVGSVAGFIVMPGFAFAATYAVGKVFVLHFEAGGTLLDFDPLKMRRHFEREFSTAR